MKKIIKLLMMTAVLAVWAAAQPAIGVQPASADPYWNMSSSGTYSASVVAAATGWPESYYSQSPQYFITSFSVANLPTGCTASLPQDYIGTQFIQVTCTNVAPGVYTYVATACDNSFAGGRCRARYLSIVSS